MTKRENEMSFVHLHVHSHYSLLKASCTIPALIDKCREFKMPAMALTDYGNMFGALEFYFEAMKKNINPILACEICYVEDYSKKEKMSGQNFRNPMQSYQTLVLLAKNSEGYRNLCCINTEASQKGFYFTPRADYALLKKRSEGLIALTGAGKGKTSWLFHNKGKDFAIEEIKKLKSIFVDNLYLELQPLGILGCEKYNMFLAEAGSSLNLPLVSAGDVHYVEQKDSLVQDVLFCIGLNRTLYDKERAKLGPPEFYLKSPEQMRSLFDYDFYKEACDNTLKIAEQCSVRFKIKDEKNRPIYHLPQTIQGEEFKNFGGKRLGEPFQGGQPQRGGYFL